MRILFALPYVPSLIRVRSYNFIQELARRHEITVLATSPRQDLAAAQSLRTMGCAVEVIPFRLSEGLKSCMKAAIRGEPLQAAICQSPRLEQRLRRLVSDGRYDIVHVEHLRAAHLGKILPRGLPAVYDSVDCISLLLERTMRASHSLPQRILAAVELRRTRSYEAHILREFDRVAVTSPQDGQALRALNSDSEIAVIPNGVDLNYFRPESKRPEPATLVLSGKMSYHANVTAALHFVNEILPLIRQVRPDVQLRIVGSRPPASIKVLARDPAVTVSGHLADIRDGMAGATVAICPVTVKVGIQNKVLEAMAMGLPVVCTRMGYEGLLAKPGQDLLVAGSSADFANQVCRLLSDPDLRHQIGQAGRHYVETYHRWAAAAERLESLYLEAINRRGRQIPANADPFLGATPAVRG